MMRIAATVWVLLWSLLSHAAATGPTPTEAGAADSAAPTPGATSGAESPAVLDRDDLVGFVDGFVGARMRGEPVAGVTVSVVQGGELILAKGYGFDDVAARRPVEADRSLFRPGSISKTFTWTAVMQLVEQGRIDLDEDIQSYLPNLEIEASDTPITLRHLMAHTPGYEETAMGHLFGNRPDAVPGLLDYLREYRPARVRPPGILPAYSNYGVGVAGLIVANVSGMAWEDYADTQLFEPLGMRNSTFREPWTRENPAPMPRRLAANLSKGYVHRGGRFEAGTFEFIGHVGPAGALSTTATDMARWMLAHLNHGRLGETRILEAETARRMHRQHFAMDPRLPGMAHGFIESHPHGYRAIGHGGGTIHFLSDMQMIPELDLGVFISTNTTEGGGALIREFVTALVERYHPPGPLTVLPDPGASAGRPLAEYTGTYLSSRRPFTTVEKALMTSGAEVSAADGALVVISPLGETRLEPLGGDHFREVESGQRFVFTSDRQGVINALLLPIPVMVMERVGQLATPTAQAGLLGACAFVLACAIVGAWLRRKRPPAQTAVEIWAARLIIVTAVVWLVSYGLALSGVAPLADDFAAVFYAFPSGLFVAALALALVAAALTVLSALLLIPVWRSASWPMWRRLRHTGVVVAAVITLLVLRDLNAIGFNYL